MRLTAVIAFLAAVALAAAGCGGGAQAGGGAAGSGDVPGTAATTDALQLHASGSSALPPGLVQEIDSLRTVGRDSSSTQMVEVYGPDSRAALVRASSGEVVAETARERQARFYLIVLRGHFVCESCSRPPGAKPPRGTIETQVWSPTLGGTDFGLSDRLGAGMPRLHRFAVLTLS
jgi:hypothetical protein